MDSINKKREFIIKFLYFLIILGIIVFIFKYALPILSPFIFAFLIFFKYGGGISVENAVRLMKKTL